MVQFHQDGGEGTSKAHWWKLKHHKTDTTFYRRWTPDRAIKAARDYLSDHRFASTSTTNLQRLFYSCTRAERGMLCYESCNITELRDFCEARRLKGVEDKGEVDTIEQLEAADEARVFDKFLNLPAELRLAVYGYAFNCTAESTRINLAPPPISQVSQLLRHESMPAFYGTSQLTIQCTIAMANFSLGGQDIKVWQLITPLQPTFFEKVPLSILHTVTSFTFEVSSPPSTTDPLISSTKWTIGLPFNGQPSKVKRLEPEEDTPQLSADRIAAVEPHIEFCLASMTPAKAGGPVTLQRSDIYKITDVALWEDGNMTYGANAYENKAANLKTEDKLREQEKLKEEAQVESVAAKLKDELKELKV